MWIDDKRWRLGIDTRLDLFTQRLRPQFVAITFVAVQSKHIFRFTMLVITKVFF